MIDAPSEPLRTVILGQGYVGLPLAIRAAQVGHQVVGFDTDADRVKRLQAAESSSPDVPAELIATALANGLYAPTTRPEDLAGFDVAIIAVPTPLHDGAPDLSAIEHAGLALAPHLQPGCVIILESTTYPGNRIWTLQNTPKIVSGVDDASLKAVSDFYRSLVDTVVEVAAVRDAELAKLLENTFRQVNIALVNEIAVHAQQLGTDIWAALNAASTKPFGFMHFTPGPGVGGHCLPVDPTYLSWQVRRQTGQALRLIEAADEVNSAMPAYIVKRLTDALNRKGLPVNGSRILLLGMAYKPNTGDTRNSPTITIARLLAGLGAHVEIVDPHADDPVGLDVRVHYSQPTANNAATSDAVVLLTDHDAFDLQLIEDHAPYVLDCRARLSGANVERL
ncbi:putative UDP-glucose 6-dehydrogenase [Streptomyces lydicamycinicus]|uniref:Putative UDP-glucose 6-dehydrogenase n=1 Tax=Streptomyces lydicamycinicus TaxID=1546107 RepID=A0A0P4RA41_9ACTN|nr:nucleotide sugar dehydrogenase [Streptomyces lydicamycinicus]GAO09842.1 putative UDP-glucose 6-dehydrogenase [Streptomyces lydicamycinicus]